MTPATNTAQNMPEHSATGESPGELATKLCDQMDHLHALNNFFHVSIEALLRDMEDVSENLQLGFWLNMCWLKQQSEQVQTTVNHLHEVITDCKKSHDRA